MSSSIPCNHEECQSSDRGCAIDGTVYFAERNGLIKIGWTRNIAQRMRALSRGAQAIAGQTVGPVTRLASYRGSRWVEAELHHRFAEYRVAGEWFVFDGALRQCVNSLIECENVYWLAVLHPETAPEACA